MDKVSTLKVEAFKIVTSLLNEQFASETSQHLLGNFLKISAEQLEEWEENPEGKFPRNFDIESSRNGE